MNSESDSLAKKIVRRGTRPVFVRDLTIGGGSPVSVQSMCATKTQNLDQTLAQIALLQEHGADLIRIAVDSKKDVECLKEIRKNTSARLVVDIQESYRLITAIAPYVDKVRYNPGHLHHHEKETAVFEKVKLIVETSRAHGCAVRIGVNFGSLDPSLKREGEDPMNVALKSVDEHIGYMDDLDFKNFVVSLKSSDPNDVIEINRRFAAKYSDIPLHLGVTEAGMLPMGEIKSRIAFENLLAEGIGDTLRVSLTLPYAQKFQEVQVGKRIIEDVYAGRFRSVPKFENKGLNIISCPSCSRVENEAFVELAQKVKEMTRFASDKNITIAVMGCRVNGPGETDDADLGLWCAPNHVNLKKQGELLGAFSYDEIISKLEHELNNLIEVQKQTVDAA